MQVGDPALGDTGLADWIHRVKTCPTSAGDACEPPRFNDNDSCINKNNHYFCLRTQRVGVLTYWQQF